MDEELKSMIIEFGTLLNLPFADQIDELGDDYFKNVLRDALELDFVKYSDISFREQLKEALIILRGIKDWPIVES
jgi:hypothetical protein